jgi:tetratricopeptide (TPR) repeat protein
MKSDIDKSMCLNNMGITYAKLDQYDQALQCFQDSLSIREKYLSPNHPDIGICYTNIGVILSSRDQLDDALKNYQLALKCFSINNSVQIFRAIVYQNMGEIFQNKNQFPRALTSYQDAHNIFQQLRPIDHPNVVYLQQQIEQMKQLK